MKQIYETRDTKFSIFVGHMSICGATDTPCFGRLVTFYHGFHTSEWVLPVIYAELCGGVDVAKMPEISSKSGVTPFPVYNASIAASHLCTFTKL